MRHERPPTPAVVIYAQGSTYSESATPVGGHANGLVYRETGILDPHRIAVEAPELWAEVYAAMCPHPRDGMAAFHICEKTDRLWRLGERTPQFRHVVGALRSDRGDEFYRSIREGRS